MVRLQLIRGGDLQMSESFLAIVPHGLLTKLMELREKRFILQQ
jgi:hypothetical protein